MGKRLASEKLQDAVLICSPAARTRETAQIMLKHSRLRMDQRFDERIYEASLRDLLQVVSEIPDDKQIAMLIGHNPGFEELLAFLTGEAGACRLVRWQRLSWMLRVGRMRGRVREVSRCF